jgi:hypothetical protein
MDFGSVCMSFVAIQHTVSVARLSGENIKHLKRQRNSDTSMITADTAATKATTNIIWIAKRGEGGKGRRWVATDQLLNALALAGAPKRLVDLLCIWLW